MRTLQSTNAAAIPSSPCATSASGRMTGSVTIVTLLTVALWLTFGALAAVGFATHAVNLSWTASTTPNVTYNLYRSKTAGLCSGTPYATGILSTAYVDNLGNGQHAYYNVQAEDVNNNLSTCANEIEVVCTNTGICTVYNR